MGQNLRMCFYLENMFSSDRAALVSVFPIMNQSGIGNHLDAARHSDRPFTLPFLRMLTFVRCMSTRALLNNNCINVTLTRYPRWLVIGVLCPGNI